MATHSPQVEGWQLEGNSAEAYERYLASAFAPWANALTMLAEVKEGDRVLDAACGTGIVARQAAQKTGPRGRVVGLDINEDMLRVARIASAGTSPAIEWRQGNAAELPFPASTFDAVLCEQALQFFSDPVSALGDMGRVLTPGGRLACSVCRPIQYCPTYVTLATALERHVSEDAGAMMRSPFSRWDLRQLRQIVVDAGFRDVQIRIEVGSLRYPSVEEFLRREAASSPLAGPIGAIDAERRRALVDDLEGGLSDHVDDLGLVCPIEAYVVRARVDTSTGSS